MLVPFEGGKKSTGKNELAESNKMMRENLPEFLEYLQIRAELKRNYYEHLIKQGFTKKEALELVAKDAAF